MKKLIKEVARLCGFQVLKSNSLNFVSEDQVYGVVASQCNVSNPVVIDGGAHMGDATLSLIKFFPNGEFHCFEPDPHLNENLIKIFYMNNNVHVIKSALGSSSGISSFNINNSRATNSLLNPSSAVKYTDKSIYDLIENVEVIDVNIVSIDEYCANKKISKVDIIKIDLQGYDLKALLGSKRIIKTAQVVVVEMLFDEIYVGCGLFSDIYPLMREYGFELYTLCGLRYNENKQILWADGVFVSKNV